MTPEQKLVIVRMLCDLAAKAFSEGGPDDEVATHNLQLQVGHLEADLSEVRRERDELAGRLSKLRKFYDGLCDAGIGGSAMDYMKSHLPEADA